MTADLRIYDYEWTKETLDYPLGPGPRIRRRMGMHALLCRMCLAESERSTRKPLRRSIAVWLVFTVVAFFVAQRNAFGEVATALSFVILSGIPFLFVVTYARLRRNPFFAYIGIKTFWIGVRVILKNEDYAALFKLMNQRMDVEVRPGYAGHRDIINGSNCMGVCCVFGGILPWLIAYALSLLP